MEMGGEGRIHPQVPETQQTTPTGAMVGSFCQAGERQLLEIRPGATSSSSAGSGMPAGGLLPLPGYLPGLEHRLHPERQDNRPACPAWGFPGHQGVPGAPVTPVTPVTKHTHPGGPRPKASLVPACWMRAGKENHPREPHVPHGQCTMPRGWAGPVARGLHPTPAGWDGERGRARSFWEDTGMEMELLTRSRALTLRWSS